MEETKVKWDNGVRVNMSGSGEAHADFIVKGMPLEMWKAWDKSCQDDYHNIRWLKIWSDHLIAQGRIKDRDKLVNDVLDRVNMEMEYASRRVQEEDDEDGISVLTGKA